MPNTAPQNELATGGHPSRWTGAAALWASAFVLMALIIVQAGRLGGPVAPAYADVTTAGSMTIITTQGTAGEDVVAILDSREDIILLYGVDGTRRVQLLQALPVQQLFDDLSGRRGGTQR